MTQTHERLESGTATISGNPSFEDGPWTVHGTAQAAEVTVGVSGEPRYWPPETLADAASKLEGTPIVDPDDHQDLEATQPHPEIVIGEVTEAAYDADAEALVYEGEIDDPERAKQIARGRVDVSPSVGFKPGDEEPERNAQRVAEVVAYRDLAVVTEGAHASASIDLGTAEALARHFDIDAEAAAANAPSGGDDGPNDVAGDGEGPSTPGQDSDHDHEQDRQTTTADAWRTAMSDTELSDEERELLAAAGQKDNPTVVEAAAAERLSEHEELLDEYEALESPTLVEEDVHETLQERVATVEAMMADALQERTGLSDPAIEAMPFEAMAAEFETDDGDLDLEALTQSPETGGSPSPDEDEDVDLESLQTDVDADDRDEAVEALQELHERYENVGWESNAQEVAEDLETLGVEVEA